MNYYTTNIPGNFRIKKKNPGFPGTHRGLIKNYVSCAKCAVKIILKFLKKKH